jgi:DNA-binding transcriptional LysR family regulator
MFAALFAQGGLSLDRLRSFCLVAQAGGMTKAAEGDSAKQSLFSRQVKELEEFFGAELMRRHGKGIALTRQGERLHLVARECFSSLMDFQSQCRDLPVEIVVGSGESLIQWLLMPKLSSIRKVLPRALLKFLNLSSSEVVRRLADGRIDFGVVKASAISRPLRSASLGVLQYSLFAPQDLAGSASGPRALQELPLAILEGEGSFRKDLSELLRKKRLTLNIAVECASFPLAAQAIEHGGVAAILPSIAGPDLARFGLKELRVPWFDSLKREVCLAWNPRALRVRPMLEQAQKSFQETFQISG